MSHLTIEQLLIFELRLLADGLEKGTVKADEVKITNRSKYAEYNHTGRRIAMRRKERSLTQASLSVMTGISTSTLARLEESYYFPQGEEVLAKIADALDVSVGWLTEKTLEAEDF